MTRSVPPRWLAGGATADVHTTPSAIATADALLSTSIALDAAAARRGRCAVTVPALPPATHTPPSPAAIAAGSGPTGSAHETAFVRGSIRETVPSGAVDGPHRALADGNGTRPVADVDRSSRPLRSAGRGG